MRARSGRRRRAKAVWLRDYDRRQLHALAGTLSRRRFSHGLSERQEWLWDQVMVEFAYRASHASVLTRCVCLWCCDDDRHTEPPRSEEPWGDWPDDD